MKIDSTDAPNFLYQKSQDTNTITKESKIITKEPKKITNENNNVDNSLNNLNVSQITAFEKNELPVSDKVVIDAIEKANKAISGANTRFEFSIHQKTKEIMVKIIDSDSGKVIREIPSAKTLDMVAKMWEMAGIIVDERR